MPRYDSSSAEVLVYTFKDGLLSAVAHDLKLRVTSFSIDDDGDRLRAEFDAASLRVVSAMRDGREAPGLLLAPMRAEIERTIASSSVLDARRSAVVRFEAHAIEVGQVRGRLSLRGVTEAISGMRRDDHAGRHAEFRFDQRRFGITPYTAMLGALRIKPEVVVSVALPARP